MLASENKLRERLLGVQSQNRQLALQMQALDRCDRQERCELKPFSSMEYHSFRKHLLDWAHQSTELSIQVRQHGGSFLWAAFCAGCCALLVGCVTYAGGGAAVGTRCKGGRGAVARGGREEAPTISVPICNLPASFQHQTNIIIPRSFHRTDQIDQNRIGWTRVGGTTD